MNAISLTVSIRDLVNPFDLCRVFKERKGYDKWLVSVECGENGHAHLQCALYGKLKSGNVKRSILKLFNIEGNERYNVKCKLHHDFKGLVGYCVKEGDCYDSNLDKGFIEESKEYYEGMLGKSEELVKKKLESKGLGMYKKLNINEVGDLWVDYCKEVNNIDAWVLQEFLWDISHLIPFNVWSRINVKKMISWGWISRKEYMSVYFLGLDEKEIS